VRNLGLMAAIDLAPRPDAVGKRGYETMLGALKAGAMIRYTGDTLAFSPPLIITQAQIEEMFGIVADVLKTIA
jgi:beta-alanine--pyruvate transaminase